MAINYSLNVDSVTKKHQYEGFSNVIARVEFSVHASSDKNEPGAFTYSCGGYREFPLDKLSGDNFIDFSDVTYDIILEWLLAVEGVGSVEELGLVKNAIANIKGRIDELQDQANVTVGGNPNFIGKITTATESVPKPIPEPAPGPPLMSATELMPEPILEE